MDLTLLLVNFRDVKRSTVGQLHLLFFGNSFAKMINSDQPGSTIITFLSARGPVHLLNRVLDEMNIMNRTEQHFIRQVHVHSTLS